MKLMGVISLIVTLWGWAQMGNAEDESMDSGQSGTPPSYPSDGQPEDSEQDYDEESDMESDEGM